jgi:hypothetical protein
MPGIHVLLRVAILAEGPNWDNSNDFNDRHDIRENRRIPRTSPSPSQAWSREILAERTQVKKPNDHNVPGAEAADAVTAPKPAADQNCKTKPTGIAEVIPISWKVVAADAAVAVASRTVHATRDHDTRLDARAQAPHAAEKAAAEGANA